MMFFGMTADSDAIQGFRHSSHNTLFLHYSLVAFTLLVPVILLNCIIAAMNNSYSLAFQRAEMHYLHYLARCSLKKSAVLHLLAQRFGLTYFWPQDHVYLWYCHAKNIDTEE